jgi:small subunit ribosomal protein S17
MTTQPQAAAVNRKSRVGVVVSDKNDKTIIVAVERAKRHRLYHKVIRTTKRYQVHDPENRATNGDMVRIEECRPISKLKRWQLVEVLTEREVADVAAAEIDRSLVQEMQRSAAHAAEESAAEDAGASEAGTAE